ncbi:MAG: hypothetical protein ACLFUR_05310 [Candidatus Hadarchaeia archaeon]
MPSKKTLKRKVESLEGPEKSENGMINLTEELAAMMGEPPEDVEYDPFEGFTVRGEPVEVYKVFETVVKEMEEEES